jgi:phage shock protein A
MIKFFKRFWAYLTGAANQKFDEKADPKVQLQQAIMEAQDQHRRLKEHAANVIAQQKQAELQLNRSLSEVERLNNNAHQAVLMADNAIKAGDTGKADQYTKAAETIATQLVSAEKGVEDQKNTVLGATEAAEQAKAAVQQNGQLLQQKLGERQKLLGQLEQAKMQEQMNKAMASLSETVGEEVPTLDEVRLKIEARYAKAKGMSELSDNTVDSSMREIEAASRNVEATARLDKIRAEMGIAAVAPAPGLDTGTPQVGSGTPDVAEPTPEDLVGKPVEAVEQRPAEG